MLVLTRRVGESIMIGDDVVITVVEMRGDVARLGIAAPRHVRVHREEVYREVAGVNSSAATATASDASRLAALVTASRKTNSAGAASPSNGAEQPSASPQLTASAGAAQVARASSATTSPPKPAAGSQPSSQSTPAVKKPVRVPKPAPPARHETVDGATVEPAAEDAPPVTEPTG